ncbi:MAG: hypothetical protein JXB48_05900, partial [Candidatus Latescibacteria bacterium]|nr:hypothetical protein [Candidatus Latescibacterota bacterium]
VTFAPCPENIFPDHINEYFERSQQVCPKLEAICGKWEFEDLIPGLSDFDTRFIFSDDVTSEEWPEISRAIGQVHTDICIEKPDRARILEHLPGINLTWKEALEPASFYPEFKQWTMYHAPEDKKASFETYLKERSWDDIEELFNIKKFALYFTPYDRSIDPAINLHEFESKYPLHSRIMHYFCPPLQSAVNIRLKRMIRGKIESFRLARDLFPNPQVIDELLDILGHHYEVPDYYREPKLSEFETMLFEYLKNVLRVIQPEITVIDASPEDSLKELKVKLGRVSVGVWNRFFDGAKFCRLMMGRLNFYAEEIPHFDSFWLIENEIKRIRKLFFETTFSAFGQIMWGVEMNADEALERCRNQYISEQEYAAVKAYASVFGKPYDTITIKRYACEIAHTMGPFQIVLDKLTPLVHQKMSENYT